MNPLPMQQDHMPCHTIMKVVINEISENNENKKARKLFAWIFAQFG